MHTNSMLGGCLPYKYRYLYTALDTISFLGVSPNRVHWQPIKIEYPTGTNGYRHFRGFQKNCNQIQSRCRAVLIMHITPRVLYVSLKILIPFQFGKPIPFILKLVLCLGKGLIVPFRVLLEESAW